MKKFLLSLAVLAFGANVMNAEVFNVNDATDFDGTLIEEVNTDKKAAKHYDPLNSLKLGGYTLTLIKTEDLQIPLITGTCQLRRTPRTQSVFTS